MGNTIIMIGRLGADPEMRYTPSGTPVTNFSLANDVGYGDNKTTVWFRVNCWNKQAEVANEYLAKGNRVQIVGELSERKYTANNGEQRSSLEIRCRELEFVETSGRDEGSGPTSTENRQPAAPVEAEVPDSLPW